MIMCVRDLCHRNVCVYVSVRVHVCACVQANLRMILSPNVVLQRGVVGYQFHANLLFFQLYVCMASYGLGGWSVKEGGMWATLQERPLSSYTRT